MNNPMYEKAQLWTNDICLMFWRDAMRELEDSLDADCKSFGECEATVIHTKNYYIFRLHMSVYPAVISIKHDACFDLLRRNYGYDKVVAQDIDKFCKEYGQGREGCEKQFTWRAV